MSSIHIPPIPSIKMVTQEGYPTPEMAMWNQQLLFSRSPWTVYTPTVAHLTGLTTDCAYVQSGKWTAFRIGLSGTSDGTPNTVTLPFKVKSTNEAWNGALVTAGGTFSSVATVGGDSITLTVTKYDGSTPVNGTVISWFLVGVYEAQ